MRNGGLTKAELRKATMIKAEVRLVEEPTRISSEKESK
jgi:hypothetical protein